MRRLGSASQLEYQGLEYIDAEGSNTFDMYWQLGLLSQFTAGGSPSNGWKTSPAPAAQNVFGNWTELWPAGTFTTPMQIIGMNAGSSPQVAFQFGTGASGSEVPLGCENDDEIFAAFYSSGSEIWTPYTVPAGARLACRHKVLQSSFGVSVSIRGLFLRRV